MAQKSRKEGEIGSERREKGDLPPCSPPPLVDIVLRFAGQFYWKVIRFGFANLLAFKMTHIQLLAEMLLSPNLREELFGWFCRLEKERILYGRVGNT